MARGSDKIREQLAREQAKLLEQQRKVRAVASRLGNLSRADDTRRKVLAGAFAIDEMKFDPEWGTDFMRRFQRFLFRDDDLALFDLPPLPPEEKQRREAALTARRERAAKMKDNAKAQGTQASGNTADASAGEVSQGNAPEAPRGSTSENKNKCCSVARWKKGKHGAADRLRAYFYSNLGGPVLFLERRNPPGMPENLFNAVAIDFRRLHAS